MRRLLREGAGSCHPADRRRAACRERALRAALAHGTLPERARFIYLLMFVFLAAALPEIAANSRLPNAWDWLRSGIAIAATVLGTIWAYHLNGSSHGRHFLERYVALDVAYRASATGVAVRAHLV
ncbi:hypothetical protein ACMHYB_10425 [Sorangium sp. So ce1128]